MFHREVYGLLRAELRKRDAPFRFLDIACGDASASAAALHGSATAHYCGLDLSARSLELAGEALGTLPCPVELECCDFAEAMASWTKPVDVVWIGMSLHHLQAEAKARLMTNVHAALAQGGLFMIWEPTLLADESRLEWLDRFSALRTAWSAMTDEEFEAMESHMRVADFPETAEDWKAMGRRAGFTNAEESFTMPNRMGKVFKYWT
jgi:SAM-dependent methyltransferase